MTEVKWQQVDMPTFAAFLGMMKASPINMVHAISWDHTPETMLYWEDTGKDMQTQERWFFYRTLKWPEHPCKYFVNEAVMTW